MMMMMMERENEAKSEDRTDNVRLRSDVRNKKALFNTMSSSAIRIKQIKRCSFDGTRMKVISESRFPRLDEFDHFHYENVNLGPLTVKLSDDRPDLTKITYLHKANHNDNINEESCIHIQHWFYIDVTSNGKKWTIRRSYRDFCLLVKQLHQCVYDGKYSLLTHLPPSIELDEESLRCLLRNYLDWFSHLAGSFINCAPVLNWLEMDNRGNHLIVTHESPINTPAVAAAIAVKRYTAQANDELSFEVGDMISVIEMPKSDDSLWWRGKRGFEVGYFPSDYVEVIGGEKSCANNLRTLNCRRNSNSNNSPLHNTNNNNSQLNTYDLNTSKPVLRKYGKFYTFFRSYLRPPRSLRQTGVYRHRVFGCDLTEHLMLTGTEIPIVLKYCSEVIERNGIVDGIYRLSGVASNIKKLRNCFYDGSLPDFRDEVIVQDIHCVASLLKMYFRELPNPLLTYELYDQFLRTIQPTLNEENKCENIIPEKRKLEKLREIIRKLPLTHYKTLEYLLKHLSHVSSFYNDTGMTPKNVAIVWAPNLLRSKEIETSGNIAVLHVIGIQAVLVEYLIRFVDIIFSNENENNHHHRLSSSSSSSSIRPKSLPLSMSTKLLSLEEARNRFSESKQLSSEFRIRRGTEESERESEEEEEVEDDEDDLDEEDEEAYDENVCPKISI